MECVGTVKTVERPRGRLRLTIAAPFARSLQPGGSVCVGGACLTVVRRKAGAFRVDLVPETLRRTTLGRLRMGDRVNLERPLRWRGRVEGHLVQGHVEGVGRVVSVRSEGAGKRLGISLPRSLARFLITMGSIAGAGVSLTGAGARAARFEVALIPFTLSRTTLGALRAGDPVNIETDLLARHATRLRGKRG